MLFILFSFERKSVDSIVELQLYLFYFSSSSKRRYFQLHLNSENFSINAKLLYTKLKQHF